MTARLIPLVLLLAAAMFSSGCASIEESGDEQMQTFHSAPDQPEDAHGWGGR